MAKRVQAGAEGYPFAENFSDFTEITGWERDTEGKPGENPCSREEAATSHCLDSSGHLQTETFGPNKESYGTRELPFLM